MAKVKMACIIREHAADLLTVAKLIDNDAIDDTTAIQAVTKLDEHMGERLIDELLRIESEPVLFAS